MNYQRNQSGQANQTGQSNWNADAKTVLFVLNKQRSLD